MPYAKPDQRFLRNVGMRIRKHREQKGVSQEAFSFDCELERSYYGRIERGELNMTLLTLRKIANALGVAPAVLLQDDD